MKRFITTCILFVFLFSVPCYAHTPNQANAYYRGVKKLHNIQKVCDLNGYRSNLIDFKVGGYYGFNADTTYGLTDFTNKLIYVQTNQSDYYIERSVIHEYAHALSRIGNLHLNGVEDILYTEMPNMVAYKIDPFDERSVYCMKDKDEYFAELMCEYYYNPELLKYFCPMGYEYAKQVNIMFNGK